MCLINGYDENINIITTEKLQSNVFSICFIQNDTKIYKLSYIKS